MNKDDKLKALDAALTQIEKAYGKGSVMKLGDSGANMNIETVPTGSLSLDIALGLGGLPKGRVVEIYGPESSGKTTVALLGNTRKLLEAIRRGDVSYDFVEVMACPGGCVGGGGQPICDGKELAGVRGENLHFLDKNSKIRFSHENQDVAKLYQDFLEHPLSHKSHMILHTDHNAWSMHDPE